MGIMAGEGRMHETCRGQKEYLHTQGALALVDSEVRQRRDSFARWGDASPNRMQWSTVAQRNAQSKSAVSLVAVVEAQEGSWATERPLTSAGQSSEQRMVIHWGHDGPRRVVEGGSRREGCCCVRACLLACLLAGRIAVRRVASCLVAEMRVLNVSTCVMDAAGAGVSRQVWKRRS